MSTSTSLPPSTFGQIYQRSLQAHLHLIGRNLAELRKACRKDVITVAEAVNIRSDVLLRIESGEHDFRLKTLYALCDYYKVGLEPIVNQGQLVTIKLV
jgi:transcriptional regulator with XRE-family HTH domain